jgi:hypothetical protein
MVQIIGIVLAAFGALLLLRSLWIRSGLSARQTVVSLAAAAVVLGLCALAATGRLNWVVPVLAAAAPFARRATSAFRVGSLFRSRWPGGSSSPPPNTPSSSTADSAFFRMTLDHGSGQMDGEIKAGRHAGKRLSQLTLRELTGLAAEISDPDSMRLLESYLDRTHPAWREAAAEPRATDAPMTREAALEILGLEAGASEEEIVAAHRRLIQRLHPDRGGSTFLAAQINGAKKVLIG